MEKLLVGRPCSMDATLLVPIERELIVTDKGERGYHVTAFKEPYAIVVRGADGIRAFNMESVEIPVAMLRQQVIGLDELLAPDSDS